jgi:hypothetical protein
MFANDPSASEVEIPHLASNFQLLCAHLYNVGQANPRDMITLLEMAHYFNTPILRERLVIQIQSWKFSDNIALHCQMIPVLLKCHMEVIANKWLNCVATILYTAHHNNQQEKLKAIETMWTQLSPTTSFKLACQALQNGTDWRQIPRNKMDHHPRDPLPVVGEIVQYNGEDAMVLKTAKGKRTCMLRLSGGVVCEEAPLRHIIIDRR